MYRQKLKTTSNLLFGLRFVDEFSDPLSWTEENPSTESKSVKSIVLDLVNRAGVAESSCAAIFIDDIILFGRKYGMVGSNGCWEDSLLQTLIQISKEISVFVYLKNELIHPGNIKAFIYHSSCYFKFIPSQKILSKPNKCECVLRRRSGKVLAEAYTYEINNVQQLKFFKHSDSVRQENITTTTTSQEEDPASNLTFNLRLTDSERQAKSKTILPYLLNEDNKSTLLGEVNSRAVKGGEIIYTPDDLDDFDDEDPDDDLDV